MIASSLILHVTTHADWERWASEDDYVPAGFAAEGFIHCCSPAQLPGVLQRYYAGRSDLYLLHVDPAKLTAPVKYEVATGGEAFPHVYGALNKDAVMEVEAVASPPVV